MDFRSTVLTVIRDVEYAYFNLCYAREQLAVRNHSLSLAQRLLDEAKARQQAGVATELDVLQAEVGVATARRNLLTAQQTMRDNEDSLLTLIGQFELGTPVGSVAFPALSDSVPSFDVSYKLARDNQPDLLSTQLSIKQYEIDTQTSKNSRLPSLNLGSTLGYNTSETSTSRAYRELSSGKGYSWEAGLTFSMPWGLKAENARYRSSMSTLNQARTSLQKLEQNLQAQVRSAVRSVETNIESVEISAKATLLSVKKYELEKEKFSLGTSTPRRVLEAQDDLESSQVSELQAKVSLRTAVAELHRLEGSSLGKYKINLP